MILQIGDKRKKTLLIDQRSMGAAMLEQTKHVLINTLIFFTGKLKDAC